ncbi:MAG: helix-turn-helix domain-containing protein [Gammaproteobacteria bacterium]
MLSGAGHEQNPNAAAISPRPPRTQSYIPYIPYINRGKTGYRWLRRFQEEGLRELVDRPRRPEHSPHRTDPALEAVAALPLRRTHCPNLPH